MARPDRLRPALLSTLVALALLAPTVAAPPLSAADLPPGETIAAPGYLETVLPNGLRVALVERREVPMLAATAIVGAGSALEAADFSGASHLLEHLLFNGTSEMTQEELYDAVDLIGGYNNAHTDEDHTYFIMLVPASQARRGLEIQAAMLFDSILPAEKFDKEVGIVREEIAKGRSRAGTALDAALREALWPDTPFGRPVIGTDASLDRIDRRRVVTYYERQYVPNNVELLIMGDFAAGEMLALVEEIYGAQPAGAAPPELPGPFAGGTPGSLVQMPVEGGSTAIELALPAPGPCAAGGPEAALLAALLGADSGPLRQAFGHDQVSQISAAYLPRSPGSALCVRLDLTAGTDAVEVTSKLLAVLEELGARGPEATAVDRIARASLAGQLLMGQRIHYYGMLRADTLAACDGPWQPLLAPAGEAEVTSASVASAAALLFTRVAESARVVAAGAVEATVEPLALTGLPAAGTGEPSVGETASPAALPGTALDRTLANGLRVLVGHEPAAAVTGIHLLIRDRAAREPAAAVGIADLLHRLLPVGTELSDRAQLAARLERLGAELKTADSSFIPYDDYYTSPTHSFVRLEVPAASWLPALDLLAELVRLPRLAGDDLTAVQTSRIQQAEKDAASPGVAGRSSYRRAMLGDEHPIGRPVGGTPEGLAGVDLETIQRFAGAYLDPAGLVLSVVGPQEPLEVLEAVAGRFAGAETAAAWEPAPSWPVTADPGERVEMELGAEQSRIYFGRIAPLAPADRPGLHLLAEILSERLSRTLRESQGLAYSLGAFADVQAEPDLGWLTVYVGSRPENIETVIDGVRAEMAALGQSPPTVAEVERVRAAGRSRALMRRMTAINRARYLGLRAFTGVPAREDQDLLDAIDRVEIDEISRLAGEWLDAEAYRVSIVR